MAIAHHILLLLLTRVGTHVPTIRLLLIDVPLVYLPMWVCVEDYIELYTTSYIRDRKP